MPGLGAEVPSGHTVLSRLRNVYGQCHVLLTENTALGARDNHRTARFTNVLRVETHRKPSVVTPASRQLGVLRAV